MAASYLKPNSTLIHVTYCISSNTALPGFVLDNRVSLQWLKRKQSPNELLSPDSAVFYSSIYLQRVRESWPYMV